MISKDYLSLLPKIESAEMMFSASRSRRLSIVPVIQSLGQLEKNYGIKINMDRTNVNGSGIALGHPIGCTALRIIVSMYYEMKRNDYKIGGAALCVGTGPAMASLWTTEI